MTIEKQKELCKKLRALDHGTNIQEFLETILDVARDVCEDVQKMFGTIYELLMPFFIYELECVLKDLKQGNPDAEQPVKALHNILGHTTYSSKIVDREG